MKLVYLSILSSLVFLACTKKTDQYITNPTTNTGSTTKVPVLKRVFIAIPYSREINIPKTLGDTFTYHHDGSGMMVLDSLVPYHSILNIGYNINNTILYESPETSINYLIGGYPTNPNRIDSFQYPIYDDNTTKLEIPQMLKDSATSIWYQNL
jgi:hypothetical protein